MQIRFYFGIVGMASLLSVPSISAQDKKDKPINVQGTVLTIDKETISVRTGTVTRQVMFGGGTKFLYGQQR